MAKHAKIHTKTAQKHFYYDYGDTREIGKYRGDDYANSDDRKSDKNI